MTSFPSPRLAGALAVCAQLLSTGLTHAQADSGAAEAPPTAGPEASPPATDAEPSAPANELPASATAAPAAPSAEPPAAEKPEQAGPETSEPKGKDKDKGKGKDKGEGQSEDAPKDEKEKKSRLEPKGRVVARAELARREIGPTEVGNGDSLDLWLPTVRAGLRYRSPIEGVSATISVEFTGRVRLKDAYAQYKGDFLSLRAGQFKAPTSPFETDGRMSLPIADRGFISDILTERLEVGDRRPGVAANFFSQEGLSPKLTVGVFQGSYLSDEGTRETEFLEEDVVRAQSFVGRLEISPAPFELGTYVTYRIGTDELLGPDEEPNRFWAGGADVKVDAILGKNGLRIWLDGTIGESWYTESEQEGTPIFLSGRLMAAFRMGGIDKGEFYFEPYAMVGGLDPDLRVTADLASEAALGVNVGFWKQGRVTLQGEIQRTRKNFPDSYALDFFHDRRALLAQVGVEF